ncbi:MAG: DUF2851 family protein [Candidatus Abyssobacteria bacterium SURF_17]|uniref:DUF2851 family protein n=1 Tax=Candidatus Abyssobacteria bacterium SURF_17 TaxID=2093361 RepID=A0A419F975_9BACT|nr:MAG: DUF2851 family protein [Candidatus Abyssubacteria bacterium SURF_17]
MPFSDEYFRLFDNTPAFRDRVASKYILATSAAHISERLLRCIWYDRLYDMQRLATRDGKSVSVHSPGTWNLESGPDFKNAHLSIGGQRLKGDVELHIEPSGWRLHGHSHDPRYDNVILHVTLTSRAKEAPIVSRHGVEIAELALWDYLSDNLSVLKSALRPEEYPYRSMKNFGRCQGLLEQMPPDAALRLLHIAGDARIIAKQRRFSYEAEKNKPDQVAYAALLECMGYKAYTKQFGQLAQRLPYETLRERVLASRSLRSPEERARLTQALLLGAAGLLRPSGRSVAPDAQDYLGHMERLWKKSGLASADAGDICWKAAAVRPANLPERRIAGISHVLVGSYERGLFDFIVASAHKHDGRRARSACIAHLVSPLDDFWSYRYSGGGRRLKKSVSLIGRDRALTIVVNSYVPLGLLHARQESRGEDEESVHQLYCSLPSPLPNNITRLMEYRMFGREPRARAQFRRSARTQQGLLQIFADWCSEDPSCENCGLLAVLQARQVGDG